MSAISEDNQISPLIIYSTFQSEPSINSSDIYSTQRVGDAHLYLGKDSLNDKIYLNITCNIFPCSYNLYLELVKKPIIYPGQSYSYFVKNSKNNFTSFKIPTQKTINSFPTVRANVKQILSIAVTCSRRKDSSTGLFLYLDDKNE